ncbi:hypothetical protein C8Q79DRAFT_951624 [Trametes meyenii]|nr:hypothetical protein C8Q79DRAFT_951624 [Trametes meyenii]
MLQLQLAQSASAAYSSPMSSTPRAASPVNGSAQVARSHRVSSIQQDSDSIRRQSRLPELLTRKRTSSTPHRKDKDGTSDPFTAHPSGSASFVTYDPVAPGAPSVHSMSTTSPTSPHPNSIAGLPKRARGSLLLSSGITLPFSRSRSKYKKSRLPPPPPTPFMYSEVIEISAPPPSPPEEDEDRDRLRDAAAQSIGLDPVLLEERESTSSRHTRSFSLSQARSERSASRSRSRSRSRSLSPARSRARANSRAGAETPAARTLPPYPATQSALGPWVQRSSKVAKHHAPSSLLLFALAKQWKSRMLVLTSSPLSASPRSHTTSFSSHSPFSYASTAQQNVAHLHVFKSASGDERELDRIEIGADSVVFVSEEEIGGRRGVVRVRGVGGVEMTLSMVDQTEAHNWITAIKQAVLSERSVRAGLGAVTHSNGVEPRGDIDVMLSMRAQGLFTPPPAPVLSSGAATSSPLNGTVSPPAPSSPAPSLRSSSPQHVRPPSVAVSALRGLFGANRPRSPSNATMETSFGSISERGSGADTPPPPEDASFGRAGTSLLGMLRSNSISSERPLSPTTPISSSPTTPRIGNTAPADLPIQMGLISPTAPVSTLDQKILQDKDREHLLPSLARDGFSGLGLTGLNSRANGSVVRFNGTGLPFAGSASLHPPPRRRAWTASGPPPSTRTSSERNGFSYTHGNASAAETLGVRHNGSAFLSPNTSSPSASSATSPSPVSPSTTSSPKFSPSPSLSPSPSVNANGVGSPASQASHDGRPRSSWSSVSSLGSSEQPQPPPRTSFEFGPKRWSRQAILPKRLTPPSGPPPATPPSAAAPLPTSSPGRSSFQQQRHPYAADSPPSRSPSQRSAHSPQSIMSSFQSFSKRASGSSVRSDSTVSTTQSRGGSSFLGHSLIQPQHPPAHVRPRSAHRVSVPPPQRPVPSMALPPTPTPMIDEFGKTDLQMLPTPTTNGTVRASGYPSRPPHSAPATKTSFKETFTLRASRFSLIPPTSPPLTALPPRPDEVLSSPRPSHRRSMSNGSPVLPTIPASPIVPLEPPQPPPSGPLPPPPSAQPHTASTSSRPTLLIKRRLRMLSAPSPSPPPINPLPQPPSPAPSTINPYSLPPTPIGEPITTLQNDPSFILTLSTPPQTPLSPSLSIATRVMPPPPEQSPEMRGITSLSPPPRRGSKQISVQPEKEEEKDEDVDANERVEGADRASGSGEQTAVADADDCVDSPIQKPLSLSPHQSVASLEDVCI